MTEPEAVTRARGWIPLHRENRYQKEAAKIMTRLLAAYDELVAEVERLRAELDADQKHANLAPGESCDVCTHLELTTLSADKVELVEARDRIAAERDQLKAAVERVRLLAEHPNIVQVHAGGGNLVSRVVMVNPSEILAALDGDDGKGEAS